MKDLILIANRSKINFSETDLPTIEINRKQILFHENQIEQIKYLKKIYNQEYYLYFHLYSFYQDQIGFLNVPHWYAGRLILGEKLSSLVLEFKYDERLLLEESNDFIQSLLWTTGIYVTKMNPDEMQKFYYKFNPDLIDNYCEKFVAFIEIDNDGSYMNISYNKNNTNDDLF